MILKKVILLAMICVFITGGGAFGVSQAARYKMSGDLSNLIAKRADAIRKKGALVGSEKRKVIFYVRDAVAALKYISSQGGGVLKRRKNLIIANVSLDRVEDIVANGNDITYARLPRKFFPCEITSEGVSLTGANDLQNSGFTGKGVKIAVIDIDFKGLSIAQSNGEFPTTVYTHDFTGDGIETQYRHGTACAEIVHDIAPDAELHLLKIGDEADLPDAASYCKNNAIKMVSMSIGTFGSGPGDGTGPVDEICDDLKDHGILVVAAAGNEGNFQDSGYTFGTHWQGSFVGGGNGDSNIHEFITGDPGSWKNTIAAKPGTDKDGILQTNFSILMRWNDWPYANVDYDIYLYDYDYFSGTLGNLIDSSTDIQNGSQPPFEDGISIDMPIGSPVKFYALVVKKKSGTPPEKDIEIMISGIGCFVPPYGHSSSISTSSSSILEPADAASVLAVGAINQNSWMNGPQEDYSSQGPTNAWAGSSARIKPDICGPDGTSGYTYGATSFPGTSAAAPHVAGAAALILSMHPQYSVTQLRTAIEANAVNMGLPGKDNIYGNGRLKVDATLNSKPILEWTGEAGYASDGLEPELANGLTPLTFRIKYKDADGDAPTVHDLYIDRNGDGDYSDSAEVVSMAMTSGTDYTTGVIYSCEITIPYSGGSSNCSYYFKFSDAVEISTGNITTAIDSQTAINKPDIFQALSLSTDKSSWQLSNIPPGSNYLMDNSNKIKITNNGDGPETYSLRITGEGNGWSAAVNKNGADVNKYVLSALFSAASETSIDSSYFNETTNEDVITAGGATRAAQTIFGSNRLSEGGFLVPVGADRNLWLEFKAPTKDIIGVNQSIGVTINAEAQ